MKRQPRTLLHFSLGWEIVLILGALFFYQWLLSRWFSWLLIPFLLACLFWPFIILSALVHVPLCWKKMRWGATFPLLLHAATALVLFACIYFDPSSQLEVLQKRRGFEAVVHQIEDGRLRPDKAGKVLLPAELQYLSQAKRAYQPIRVERESGMKRKSGVTRVLFYTASRDFMGDEAAYVYCSDGKPPPDTAFFGDNGTYVWTKHTYNSRFYYVQLTNSD